MLGTLLLDVFLAFIESGEQRLPTRTLVETLNTRFGDRPWMELCKGGRMTEIWLSQQLRPFGIAPKNLRINGSILKGYAKEDFQDAFKRYIPKAELEALVAESKE